MLKYNNKVISKEGYIYSLDMIRLKLKYYDDYEGFMKWLNIYTAVSHNIDADYWSSYKEYAYRHMFKVKIEDSSFVIGLSINGNRDDRYIGFIEFNPNKVAENGHFKNILDRIYQFCYKVEVVRFDLAIDIKIPRYLCRLVKDKRNYKYIHSRSSITEYLGQRNKNGYVKLYDKKAESDLEYDLTRLEITADMENINFPEVKLTDLQRSLNFKPLNSTEKVLLQLLQTVDNPQMYMKELRYEKRKKIEPYLGQDTVLLDSKAYSQILMQVRSYQY